MKRFILLMFIVGVGGFWFYQGHFVEEEKIDLPLAIEYKDFIDENNIKDKLIVTSTDTVKGESMELAQVDDHEKTNDIVLELAQVDIEEEKVLGDKIKNNSINLAVPFTSQAPTADWSLPWNDACEEASVLMVDYYYQGDNLPSARVVQDVLFDMVEWQEKNWQGHFNLPIVELAKYVEKNYSYDYEIVDDLTVSKIRDYLDRGLPVIVPANGKKLANPYFSNGGPEYHMLVIRGYLEEEKKFISNDPGTWRGENFVYSYDNMMDSIADWDKKNSTASGAKRGLILHKN